MSRSSVTLTRSRFNRRISASLSSPPEGRENFFFLAYSECWLTPQSLRNLRDRIAALRDLSYRIPLELIAEIYLTHLRLLTSNLGKKASRNLRAIHSAYERTADEVNIVGRVRWFAREI
jgi:hypothetical protein